MDRMLDAVTYPAARGLHGLCPPQGPAGRPARSGARGREALRPRVGEPRGPARRRGAAPRQGEGPLRRSPAEPRAGGASLARRAARGPPRPSGAHGHDHPVRRGRPGRAGSGDPRPGGPPRRGRACSTTRTSAPSSPWRGRRWRGLPPTPSAREFRLYQAEHLLRQYRFRFDELPFGADGNLPLDHDPKTAWALAHPAEFPVDVRPRAARTCSCACPGIGPARGGADRDRAAPRGAARRGGSASARRGHRSCRLLPRAGRPEARARAGRPLQQGLFADGRHLPSVVWRTPTPPCAYR